MSVWPVETPGFKLIVLPCDLDGWMLLLCALPAVICCCYHLAVLFLYRAKIMDITDPVQLYVSLLH